MAEVIVETLPDGIGVVTLNRPEARNAVDQALASGVAAAIDDLEQEPSVAVLIITGAGGTFCAGMDLKAFASGGSAVTDRGFGGVTQRPPGKPLIAAVEGWA